MTTTWLRAALLGTAIGLRSMTGVAALALTTPAGTRPPWVGRLGSRWGRRLASIGAAGEILADKNSRLPSRLEPPVLVERIAVGSLAAVALARREKAGAVLPAAVAAAAVVAASYAGVRWRAYAQEHGRPTAGAAVEDLTAITLSATACLPGR